MRGAEYAAGDEDAPAETQAWLREFSLGAHACHHLDCPFVKSVVDVQCPDCGHASQIEYRRLGAASLCPGCKNETAPLVPVGGTYPVTQWELNFRDFLVLIRESESRHHVEPLLRSWFAYRLDGVGSGTQIVDSSNHSLDRLTVHLEIQEDPAKQFSLYQTAMSLWR